MTKKFHVQQQYGEHGFIVEAETEAAAILEIYGDWETCKYLGQDRLSRSIWKVTVSSPDRYNQSGDWLLVYEITPTLTGAAQ
jgi:hypothetical protein